MKLSEKIQEALREQQEINLSDPAVQRRLAAQWGYVPAGAQPAPSVPSGLHPLETVRFWADAYTHPGDDNFRGHGMAAALLREYAELRAALAAAPEAKP